MSLFLFDATQMISKTPVRLGLVRLHVRVMATFCLSALLAKDVCGDASRVIEAQDSQLTPLEVVEVAAGRAGLIAELNVAEGRSVTRGEPVARLDDERSRIDAALAREELEVAEYLATDDVDVRHAEKSLAVARSELKRSEAANERLRGSIPLREIEYLQLSVERAELAVEQAERKTSVAKKDVRLKQLRLELAELDLRQHTLAAPVAGIVVKVNKRRGEWIEPGESIFEISPTDRVRAEGFIASRLALVDLRGARALFKLKVNDGKTLRLRGRVTFVSLDVNPVNELVRVRAEFPSPELVLRPGLSGDLMIEGRPVEVPIAEKSVK